VPCSIKVDRRAKRDALDIVAGNPLAWAEIDLFLRALPSDPLPRNRREFAPAAFFVQLPCGVYVAWEIIGDMVRLVTLGPSHVILVRVLGVGRQKPRRSR
jgi:hypothetical protein